jgi:hypothetical protein
MKILEDWQRSRVNKVAKKESLNFECKRSEYIQDLTLNIHDMSAESLNIWLTKKANCLSRGLTSIHI